MNINKSLPKGTQYCKCQRQATMPIWSELKKDYVWFCTYCYSDLIKKMFLRSEKDELQRSNLVSDFKGY